MRMTHPRSNSLAEKKLPILSTLTDQKRSSDQKSTSEEEGNFEYSKVEQTTSNETREEYKGILEQRCQKSAQVRS